MHHRQLHSCVQCGGVGICLHNRQQNQCTDCSGSKVCRAHCLVYCGHLGNPNYDGYCTHCFGNLFKDDPRTANIHKKSKETKWVNEILTQIPLPGWTWDKPIYVDFSGGRCSTKRRTDLRLLVEHPVKGLFWLCTEIDENQHKYYAADYECERYNDLFLDFSGRYVFLRVNPDPFRFKGQKVDPSFKERFAVVKSATASTLESGPLEDNLVEVHRLFYDAFDEAVEYQLCTSPLEGLQKVSKVAETPVVAQASTAVASPEYVPAAVNYNYTVCVARNKPVRGRNKSTGFCAIHKTKEECPPRRCAWEKKPCSTKPRGDRGGLTLFSTRPRKKENSQRVV